MYPFKLLKPFSSLELVESRLKKMREDQDWLAFKQAYCEGDEIWSFTTSDQSWEMMCGRSGYALVRDGTVICFCVTLIN